MGPNHAPIPTGRWAPFARRHDSKEIKRVADWAAENRAQVYCGEFGAYRRFAPREGRLKFTRDLRLALEKHRIGWAMWDYRGGFSLLEDPARRNPDEELLTALGLGRKRAGCSDAPRRRIVQRSFTANDWNP